MTSAGAAPAEADASRAAASSALAAAAAVVLAGSLLPNHGAYHPLALAGVTLAIAAALGGLALAGRGGAPAEGARDAGRRWTLAILWLGVGASLALDLVLLPGVYVDPGRLGGFRPLLGVLAALAATHAWRAPERLAGLRFAAELAVVALLAGLVLRASPAPAIDVWVLEALGAKALLDGVNPYSVAYPNIYGPGTPLIAPSLLSADGRWLLANPYTPLTLLLVAPAVAIASDPRWAMIAATLFAAWAVRRLGRGSREAGLAALFLLVQPRGLFVLEQSWTEPLVLASVLGAALAVRRLGERAATSEAAEGGAFAPGRLAVAAVAGAAALAVKQYSPLLLLPLALAIPRAARVRVVALAAAGAVAVTAPFVLWDARGLVRGVLRFQLEQPFRADALSWPAALFRATGVKAPAWIAFAAAAAIVAWTVRGRVTVARALLGGALAWTVFVALSKQAFCNYYWLAVGLLCAAVAAASAPAKAPGGDAA